MRKDREKKIITARGYKRQKQKMQGIILKDSERERGEKRENQRQKKEEERSGRE